MSDYNRLMQILHNTTPFESSCAPAFRQIVSVIEALVKLQFPEEAKTLEVKEQTLQDILEYGFVVDGASVWSQDLLTRAMLREVGTRDPHELEVLIEKRRTQNDYTDNRPEIEERAMDMLDWLWRYRTKGDKLAFALAQKAAHPPHPYSATFVVTVYTPKACSMGKHKERIHNAFCNHPQFPTDITFMHYEDGHIAPRSGNGE